MIFQTQGSNWCLLHLLQCRWILYPLSQLGINPQLLCYLRVSCSLHSMNSSKPQKLTGYLVRQTGKIGVHKNSLYPHRCYILTFVGKEGRQIIKQTKTHNKPPNKVVKNPPAMWETWVLSLGWEDPLEEGMATQSSILAWRIPMDRVAWQVTVHGLAQSRTQLSNKAQHKELKSR